MYQAAEPDPFGITACDAIDCLLRWPWASIAVTLNVYLALLWSPVTVAVVAGASTVTGGCATVPLYGVTSYFAAGVAPFFGDAFQVPSAFSLLALAEVIVGAPGAPGVAGRVVGGALCAPPGAASSTTMTAAHIAP